MTSVIFAPSSTTSSALDLTVFQDTGRARANALIFPSGFVSGTVYVNSSSDLGATYQPIYVNGTRYGVAAAAGQEVLLDFGVMDSVTNFQLVSSVTQTAGCTVTVIVVDASKAASVGGEFASGGGGSSGGTGTNGQTAPTTSVSNGYTNSSGNQTAVSPTTPLPVTFTNQSGSTGTDQSANKPTLPNVGSNFAASGPYANYILIKTIAAANRYKLDIENISGAQIAVVRDDGTAANGAAPANASVFALAGGSSAGAQGGAWSSTTFQGRIQIYAASSAAIVTVMVD